jgi:hypothetical protein
MTLSPPENAPDTVPEVPSRPSASVAAPAWRGPAVAALWVAFLVYNLALGPGSLTDTGDLGLIMQGRFSEVNDLLLAVFNAVGQTTAVYASLLLPAAPRQNKLTPTIPFTLAGMVVGFAALGPYLAFRTYAPDLTAQDLDKAGPLAKWFEGKANAVLVLGYALFIYYLAFAFGAPSEARDVIFYACWQNTAQLFDSNRFVHGMLIDGALLCTLLYGPLTEDMRRRGWIFDKNNISSYLNAFCILAAPCIGPAVYLLLRPSLPDSPPDMPSRPAS